MATVVEERKDPITRFGSQVDEQIAQTTSRIRVHDLAFGSMSLAAFVCFYAAAMILLDKYLNLSDGVRQLALAVFLAAAAGITFYFIVRPLRQRINPLYAAARVEKTIDDAKNSVTGYVEAQKKGEVHAAVKAAMSARAAQAVGDADVNHAVDHRGLLVAGAVLAFLLLVLIVLFFAFRPAQFKSLIGRSFAPFASGKIASRTQIDLLKPDPAEPTITSGQTITVAIHIGGRVPAAEAADRVRVLIRHNQSEHEYEEIPMKEGETSRDWQVKVPEEMVLNGFYYKVAGGDAETPEYRVTVRQLPLFTDFQAIYEYPAYTNKPKDQAASADIRAPRGTKVSLVASTNRQVSSGSMVFLPRLRDDVPGRPAANRPDTLEFHFTVAEPAKYKLYMTTQSGEKNADSPPYSISVDTDEPPVVQIVKPEEPDVTAPANGQLAVDATVGDDYGIDKVRLRLRVDGRDLAPIPYMEGKSFKRDKDGTWPRDLAYKDSADLTKLKYADGVPFEAKEGMTLEYWVEAIDNCSETKPAADWGNQVGNVGRSSPVRKLTLTAPKTAPNEKQKLDQNKGERKNQEKQHNQAQQQKLDTEKREPPRGDKQPQQGDQRQPQEGQPQEGQPQNGQQQAGDKQSQDPKTGDKPAAGDPMNRNPENKNNEAGNPDSQPNPMKSQDPNTQKGQDPNTQKGGDALPMGGNPDKSNMGMNNPDGMDKPMQPNPTNQPSPDQKRAEDEARQVQQELDRNKRPEGESKSNPAANPEERTEPAASKPQPKDGDAPDSQPKEQPKSDPANKPNGKPMGEDKSAPGQSRSEGNLEKPAEPSQPKPGPNQSGEKNAKKEQPAETRDEPLGAAPGQDKPEPKSEGGQNAPKNQDLTSGSQAKSATDRKAAKSDPGNGNQNGSPESGEKGQSDDKQQAEAARNAGKAKPMTEPSRGRDRESADNKPGGGEQKPQDSQEAATPKPQKTPESGAAKPNKTQPSGDKKEPDASEPKAPPGDPNDPMKRAAETKPDRTQPQAGGAGDKNNDKVEKGMDKSEQPGASKSGGSENAQKEPKLDPKQMEDLKNAANDLNSSDPKKQEEARNKLDKTIGEKNRKDIEQLQKDLQSSDPATREAAKQKVENMMKKAQEQAKKENGDSGANGQKPMNDTGDNQKNPMGGENAQKEPKLDPKQMEDLKNAANDLNSSDPKKQEEARKKLDKTIGEKNRKDIEDLQKDLQSSDPAKREAAKRKVEDMMKKAQEQAKKDSGDNGANGQKPMNGTGDNQKNPMGGENAQKEPKLDPKQMEDLKNAANDLNSSDPKKQEEARKKLDKTIGEKNRKDIEQLQKDLQSSDPATREAAKQKVENMMKKAQEQAKKENGGDEGKEPSPEEIADLKNKARNLNSNDPAKREAAEKALDEKLGRENREKLQEQMKNQKPGDPEGEEDLKKEIEKQAKNLKSGGGTINPTKPQGSPSASREKPKPPIEDDPKNRAKAAELQLEEFEKNRYNKDLQDRLGWTQDQYEKFLEAQRKRVEQLEKEVAAAEQAGPKKPDVPAGPPMYNASGGKKVETRENGKPGAAGAPGAVFAPPGFEDAQKRFNKELDKLQKKP